MKKQWLILFGLLILPSLVGAAGEDGKVTVDPIYQPGGNTSREINVPLSTSNIVLISSAPADAVMRGNTTSLEITNWRFREIVNVSTCAALALYTTSRYNAFSSTFGVVLSSDSTGLGAGDVYVVPHQDQVWGIWTPASGDASCAAGAGAGGDENYHQPGIKRR